MLPATNGYEFSGNCPEGSGAVFESSCFFIIDIPTASWNYARWTCENYGADLAVIKSVNENNIILNLVTNQPTVQALGVWIGLQRNFFQDYAFYWVDDTPLEYSAWAESQPSSTREECVHTVTEGQENGKWNDNYCDHLMNASSCHLGKDPQQSLRIITSLLLRST
ncbi:low affinity immunoglobulin epsilon Fc receptor-like [Pocillopora verrucosa]|uniref:low affinity immunoglobulin epsilon Fc receptor-like n=1 Tax=Pocillopora verrucosa TaxID=203993 RepID=UPI00333E2467